MRNFVRRLVLWLCARYDIHLVNEARIENGRGAIERGEQWEQFAREEGGLYDMIDEQRRKLFHAYTDVSPTDRETKDNLAMQDRCWQQVKLRIDSVIQNGRVEADNKRKIAAQISPIRKSV